MSQPSEFRAGVRESAPLLLALFPFGMVYGALAVDAGLTIAQTLGFSLTTYAGASQLVTLQMVGAGSPVWAVLVAVVAINFRHVLYSASVGRHLTRFGPAAKALAFFWLVDPSFAAAEARAANGILHKSYYFAYALVLYVGWAVASLLGAVFGGLIDDPHALALDFVLPIYFLAQTMAFRHRSGFAVIAATSGVTGLIVYATLGSPWHVTLGAVAGMTVAVLRAPRERPAAYLQEDCS